MDGSSFFSSQFPGDPTPEDICQEYKQRLQSMKHMFLFGINYREVTNINIDTWEQELRGIVKGVEWLRTNGVDTFDYISSVDGFQTAIWNAIQHLYLASDILALEKVTLREKKSLYQNLRECQNSISTAIDYFIF